MLPGTFAAGGVAWATVLVGGEGIEPPTLSV